MQFPAQPIGVLCSNEAQWVCNAFATNNAENPVNTPLLHYANDNFSSQRDNSTEYQKRANFPENIEFSGISLYSDKSIRHHKHIKKSDGRYASISIRQIPR